MKSVDIRCRVSTVGIDFFFLFLIFCQPLIFFSEAFLLQLYALDS